MPDGKRTYRRTPQDIAEAKFISGLIDDFVNKSAKQLAEEERHDELQALLGYRKTWRGIVADLGVTSAEAIMRPIPSASDMTAGKLQPSATETPDENVTARGDSKSGKPPAKKNA